MSSMWVKEEESDGVVVAKDARKIWVAPASACESTSGCGGGCMSCAGAARTRKTAVYTEDTSGYTPGDQIRFRHFIPNANIVSLIVFGLPLIVSIFLMLIWYVKSPESIESPAAILSAGAAFVGGFAIVGILDLFFRKKFPSKVLHRLQDKQLQPGATASRTEGSKNGPTSPAE